MPGDVSALQLVLTGDPALMAIVRLSLIVSLSAVFLAALIGVPFGALIALTRFPGRQGVIVVLNALMGLPPVVVGLAVFLALSRSGPLGSWGLLFTPKAMVIAQTVLVAPIIAALTRQTIEDLWIEYRDELTAMNIGPGRPSGDADLGRALQPGHRAACRFWPRGSGGRRHHHCRRKYRWIYPHHDDCDRAGDFQRRPAARCRARHGADLDRGRGQRARLDRTACGRAIGGMNMRAPTADLPIGFENVTVAAGAVTILDRITLTLVSGPPTVLVGPNGSGKTTLLRAAMGLIDAIAGAHNMGRTGRCPADAARHRVPAPGDAQAQCKRQYPLCFTRGRHPACRTARVEIGELLGLVGLEHVTDRPARRLSGGEQQRLALARALARDPAVLFLDEPTASLDPAATKAIEDVIHAVSQRGIKVVMSTHDLGEARRLAGEIIMLHRGRVIETGPASSFFNTPQTGEAKTFIAGELLV